MTTQIDYGLPSEELRQIMAHRESQCMFPGVMPLESHNKALRLARLEMRFGASHPSVVKARAAYQKELDARIDRLADNFYDDWNFWVWLKKHCRWLS